MKILVICHGNICRSPIAAAILADAFEVRQGGFTSPGRRSPPKVRAYAQRIGLDLEEHRSRLMTSDDIRWADKVLYMDGGNLKRFLAFKLGVLKAACLGTFHPDGALVRLADPNFLSGDAFNNSMENVRLSAIGFGLFHA